MTVSESHIPVDGSNDEYEREAEVHRNTLSEVEKLQAEIGRLQQEECTMTQSDALYNVLADLSDLVPDRFRHDAYNGYHSVMLSGQEVRQQDARAWLWKAAVVAACQEECEVQGWWTDLMSPTYADHDNSIRRSHFQVAIWNVHGASGRAIKADAGMAALAFAKALRESLTINAHKASSRRLLP